ncbi:MAG: hydroxymethylbilane synthase [Bacteriovoracaceae bacterium]|nr:hydroxymethylbilane synthase [Bacteriovoracaceae bacterium]
MPTHYKIGTRGSLLALTQCGQVKDQLERLTGDKFELVIIKTQGDIIQNAPLWQLDGKDFFTKELDEALLKGEVDLVVHSYKDLGSERPEGIALAAITKRTFAHDILLIKNETIPKIKSRTEFIVGTSSPRRIVNIESKLADYLPKGKNVVVKTKMLRGNVNTRIQKLRDGDFDAIVLALPGIERLAHTPSSKETLTQLLAGINFMILPQSVFPSSASQGALGIECAKERLDQGELLNKLKLLEDTQTVEEVSRERLAFNKYGGGCHLAVGINVKKISRDNKDYFLHNHRGVLEGVEVNFNSLEGRSLPTFLTAPKTFNGHPSIDSLITKKNLSVTLDKNLDIYVTSKYCLDAVSGSAPASLWAAGTKTMKDLAALGLWVNATADAIGDDEIRNLRSSHAISLMINTKSQLIILSNDEAKSSLSEAEVIACYKREISPTISEDYKNDILKTEVFYWTSYFQYKTYCEHFPEIKTKIHACGIGKTFDTFKENNIEVYPMSGMEEFKEWTKSTGDL